MPRIDVRSDSTTENRQHLMDSDETAQERSAEVVDFIMKKFAEHNPGKEDLPLCGGCITALINGMIVNMMTEDMSKKDRILLVLMVRSSLETLSKRIVEVYPLEALEIMFEGTGI